MLQHHVVNRMYYYSGVKGDLDTSKSIFDDFKKHHILKVKKPRRLSNFYKAGGLIHFHMAKYDESLLFYEEALKHAVKTTDIEAIGEIYMGLGMVFYSQGKLSKSSENLQKSIPFFKESKSNNSIINVKNVMISLYSENGFYEEAERERKEAIELAKKEEHYLFLSQIYFNYSLELRNRDRLSERVPFIKLALENIEKSKYKAYYKPVYLSAMVIAYSEINDIENAKTYIELLEKEPRKKSPGNSISFYKEAYMRFSFAKKEYNLALKRGIDFFKYKSETKQFDGLQQASQFLAKVYETLGNDEKAYQYYKNYTTIKDSITGLKKARGLSYYQTLYETEKRDTQIIEQQNEIKLLDAVSKIKTQWLLFGGLGLLFVFGLFVAFRSKSFAQKKLVMQQKFAHQLIVAQENERKSIAKELHDGIGQDLLLIKHSVKIDVEKAPKLIDKTIENIRALSRNLHPVELEKVGITKAIINMVNEVNDVTGIFFSEDVQNIDKSLKKEEEIYLYRIIQECINNIIKHSEASASKISVVNNEDVIVLTVQDNGKGFRLEKAKTKFKTLGLQSLIERVDYLKGKIEFDTGLLKGTKIKITLYK
ncbi:MAG: hypothetical protein COA67_09285 [Lutibacter sp.]|nr:MAG: hypothetical protein COA67_09285 [Lutibacter sp.]